MLISNLIISNFLNGYHADKAAAQLSFLNSAIGPKQTFECGRKSAAIQKAAYLLNSDFTA